MLRPSLSLLLLPLLLLSSCQIVDPDYHALIPTASTNPPKDAIVGMWHRKKDDQEWKWRMNMLFNRDGTGAVESFFNDSSFLGSGERTEYDNLGTFTWTYQGQGVWLLRSQQYPARLHECRISGNKLLRYSEAWADEGGAALFVYERVSQ